MLFKSLVHAAVLAAIIFAAYGFLAFDGVAILYPSEAIAQASPCNINPDLCK